MRTRFLNPHLQKKITISIFSGLFLVIILTGCYIPVTPLPQQGSSSNLSGSQAASSAEIQFITQLPQALAPGERLAIEVLDEVTGLPYNPKWFDMDKSSDLIYQFSLTVSSGSVVKYRYAKIGQAITSESTPANNPVRYRLVYADNNQLVTDKISAWFGDGVTQTTGLLTGQVLDNETNEPIPDILVNAAGMMTFTDMNGVFRLGDMPGGTHNVVFSAIDGGYKTYQQGAVISPGMTTTAAVRLQSMPLVNISFNIQPPDNTAGVPIYIAGNLISLGNTFTDLQGGMSINPKQLVPLSRREDGMYTTQLSLHEGTDLRYKFTLGDGYWNAEQLLTDGLQTRQLIVPDHDITLNFELPAWQSSKFGPIVFAVRIPQGSNILNSYYIQLKTAEWTEPLPLWPTGDGNYYFILYSPFDLQSNISYRFCIDDKCNSTSVLSWNSGKTEGQQQASASPTSVNIAIDDFTNQVPDASQIVAAYIPNKGDLYTTAIELTSSMNPSWTSLIPEQIEGINQLSANTVIFSPTWSYTQNPPFFQPIIGTTPFNSDLIGMLKVPATSIFSTGLYPQLLPIPDNAFLFENSIHSSQWWDTWLANYHDFIISYAKLAEYSDVDLFILGGKYVLPAFSGGINWNGSETAIPETSDIFWTDLISEIRQNYHGQLVWATNAGQVMDPLPGFVNLFDQIYISVDSPLTTGYQPTIEEINSNFTGVIDNLIYEVYRSTQKPIILAFGYPSVDGSSLGCLLVSETCINDGLFTNQEMMSFTLDTEEQAQIYNAILPVVASRDWITGISMRGFEPLTFLQDTSSSIAKKPAEEVIRYWYTGLTQQ